MIDAKVKALAAQFVEQVEALQPGVDTIVLVRAGDKMYSAGFVSREDAYTMLTAALVTHDDRTDFATVEEFVGGKPTEKNLTDYLPN